MVASDAGRLAGRAHLRERYVDVASGEIHCQSEPDGTTPDDQNVRIDATRIAATRSAARDACARFHQRQWWLWDRWSSQFAQVLADKRTNLLAALMQLGFAGKKESCLGLAGTLEEITGCCRHLFPVTTLMAVNIDEMLSEIHARSRELDIPLPEKFTPQPGTPAYDRLRDTIKEYRAQAAGRLKAKGRRPKRAPSNLVKPAAAKMQRELA